MRAEILRKYSEYHEFCNTHGLKPSNFNSLLIFVRCGGLLCF